MHPKQCLTGAEKIKFPVGTRVIEPKKRSRWQIRRVLVTIPQLQLYRAKLRPVMRTQDLYAVKSERWSLRLVSLKLTGFECGKQEIESEIIKSLRLWTESETQNVSLFCIFALCCVVYMMFFDQGYNYLARLQACHLGKMGNQNMSTSPLYSLCILSICLLGFHFHFPPFDYLHRTSIHE